MGFVKFMASGTGRMVRIVAGIALILVGLFLVKDVAGYVLAAVGLAPLLAGTLDFCIFAPLFSMPFGGQAIREK
jgi:hypothetical protein